MASAPPRTGAEFGAPSAESQLSSLVYGNTFAGHANTHRYLSQNVQVVVDSMLKMISEIDQNSAGIMEEIERSKESVLRRKIQLEEEKDHFQKAAFAVLDMLNSHDTN